MSCQSGCGMILQQCYDEENDALVDRIDTLIKKSRSPACSVLVNKYASTSEQLLSSISGAAGAQPGWLGADLKMTMQKHRYETLEIIDQECK